MKRKTSTTPTKIWSFGALAPTSNGELLLEQLFLGSRYYNTLIEVEQRRRKNYRDARSEAAPALAGLEAEWTKLDAELTAGIEALPKTKGEKGKKTLTPELVALKERRKGVSVRMKAERETFSADASAKIAIQAVDEKAQIEVKAARAATDLYWGSYLLVEKQIEQARKSKLDPRFRRFEGSGRVGVQLQGGLSLAELTSGEDTRLRLVARSTPAKVKKPKALHEVHIRVGSNGRAPIWAVLPVVIHRDIPPDAKIQWAWIKVQNVGGQRRFFLQIVMESETFSVKSAPGAGVVAVNFGWRALEDGSRRVAYAVDDAGNEQDFALPAKIESSLEFCNGLRSARDLHFEEARRALGAYMALHDVPEWMKEDTQHIWQWRSPKKLAKVAAKLTKELLAGDTDVRRWRAERLAEPKQDLFAPYAEVQQWLLGHQKSGTAARVRGLSALAFYLELWRQKNRHLWQWEANQRLNATAHRNELFRIWSRHLADRYSEIRIEDFDLRKMAKTPEPDEESRPKDFRVSRAAAAPGEFRMRLAEVAGHKILKAPAHGNTVICFECRHVNERSLTRLMVCAGCDREMDQDSNNCHNQLRERDGGAPETGGARSPTQVTVKNKEPAKRRGLGDETRDIVAAE